MPNAYLPNQVTAMDSGIKFNYHRRLFAGLVVYSVVLLGCFAIFQYQRERHFKADELNLRLQGINERLIETFDRTGKLPGADDNLFAGLKAVRISVVDTQGKVIYDNTLDTLPGTNHLSRAEIAQAISSGQGYALRRHSESTGKTYFYSATRAGNYVVRSAVPYSLSLHKLLSADYAFIWFMLWVTIMMCAIGYLITRRLGRNVEKLSAFAAKAERGERIYDEDSFPHDELGDISSHIVRLYARLQQATAERDRQYDIAMHEQQEKIRIKRTLTNNINHELKTPVASIKACLETLIAHPDMSLAKREEFINRCYAANERLSRLLADVSVITRMEEGSDMIVREPVALDAIVSEACADYALLAEEKGMEIINGIDYSVPVAGNASLLGSLFRNLIDNALAYSGGTRIEIIQSLATDGFITVIFRDNGAGVAEEHIAHLFERFYRIDKGRSRRSGGTGLGLSIVRNAVLWHRGAIRVYNRKEGGLEFSFILPTGQFEGDSQR